MPILASRSRPVRLYIVAAAAAGVTVGMPNDENQMTKEARMSKLEG
jgi:hypothetical protein